MEPIIDHIHLTVADLNRAEAFYDRFLPLLGFDLSLKERDEVPEHEYSIVEYHHASFSIGLVNQRSAYRDEIPSRRKAGALHHIAFHVDSPEDATDYIMKSFVFLPKSSMLHSIIPTIVKIIMRCFSRTVRERRLKL